MHSLLPKTKIYVFFVLVSAFRLSPPSAAVTVSHVIHSLNNHGAQPGLLQHTLRDIMLRYDFPLVALGGLSASAASTASDKLPMNGAMSKRVYFCQRCLNHGLTEPRKNHKCECAYANCTCDKCILVEKRRVLNTQLHELEEVGEPENDNDSEEQNSDSNSNGSRVKGGRFGLKEVLEKWVFEPRCQGDDPDMIKAWVQEAKVKIDGLLGSARLKTKFCPLIAFFRNGRSLALTSPPQVALSCTADSACGSGKDTSYGIYMSPTRVWKLGAEICSVFWGALKRPLQHKCGLT
uniref:DM domain-containing protein n=1 Tax=Steinernema glaseri TaxID=37863 RepID=A0A1I7Y4G0_9BILA